MKLPRFFMTDTEREKRGNFKTRHLWLNVVVLKFNYGFIKFILKEPRDDHERPSLDQLKLHLISLRYLGDAIRCTVSADLRIITRNSHLKRARKLWLTQKSNNFKVNSTIFKYSLAVRAIYIGLSIYPPWTVVLKV